MTTKTLKTLANQARRKPPIAWQAFVDARTGEERDRLRGIFEAEAMHAAQLAAYLDLRYGPGCGDQGHKAAVKNSNRVARLLWCKAFGYNALTDLNF